MEDIMSNAMASLCARTKLAKLAYDITQILNTPTSYLLLPLLHHVLMVACYVLQQVLHWALVVHGDRHRPERRWQACKAPRAKVSTLAEEQKSNYFKVMIVLVVKGQP